VETGRRLVVVNVGEYKVLEFLSSGSNVDSGRAETLSFGAECKFGVNPGALFSGLKYEPTGT